MFNKKKINKDIVISMEINKEYIDLAEKRVEPLLKQR